MKISFLDKMACPFDKDELILRVIKQEQDEITEGILTCTQCHRYYPIVRGIAIMSPDEYREMKLELPLMEKWGEQIRIEQGKPVLAIANRKE